MKDPLRSHSGWLGLWLLSVFFLAGLSINELFGQFPSSNSKFGDTVDRKVPESRERQDTTPLDVTLRVDGGSFKLGDQVALEVLLTNRGHAPLYLYTTLDWGESASLSLWLKDAASGKDISGSFIADALPPPPTSRDDFIKLLPNHIYGLKLATTLEELNVRKPGRYEIVVVYHSPVPASMGFGLLVWSREKGRVTSNPVTVTVGN